MSRKTIFVVNLKDEDRAYLNRFISRGKAPARSLTRARILLMADEDRSNKEIAEVLKTTEPTIIQVKKRYCQDGLESAINEKSRSGAPSKIDSTFETRVTLLACSEPPEGRSSWTLQLLADKAVELEAIDSVSAMSIHRILKKVKQSPGRRSDGV
jgi:putative transposase